MIISLYKGFVYMWQLSFRNGRILMLNKNNKLLMRMFVSAIRNLLCKLGGVLLMASTTNAIAASAMPELPEQLILAIRSAIQAHPDVMIANSQMLSAKSQVEAGVYRWYTFANNAASVGELVVAGAGDAIADAQTPPAETTVNKKPLQVDCGGETLITSSAGSVFERFINSEDDTCGLDFTSDESAHDDGEDKRKCRTDESGPSTTHQKLQKL